MLTRPAHAVGVVHIQVDVVSQAQQLGQQRHRRQIAVHAEDAVAGVPDPAVQLREAGHLPERVLWIAVPHHADRRARRLRHPRGHVHAVVDLVIQHNGVLLGQQRRQHRLVSQRRRGGHQRMSAKQRAQLRLQLRIRWRRDIAPRGRELGSIGIYRTMHPRDQRRVLLQSKVRARRERDDILTPQPQGAALELGVLAVQKQDPPLAGHTMKLTHRRQKLRDFHDHPLRIVCGQEEPRSALRSWGFGVKE